MSDINKLTVKFDNSSVFTDYTEAMFEYGRDSSTIAVETADFIYLGRSKPFNAVYMEMGSIVNSVTSVMTAEYYDASASAWTALPLLVNEPETGGVCLARSGFVKWNKGIDTDDWGTVAIDSITQYWVRFSVSVNITATTAFKGINVLFSDDEDLKKYHPSIMKMLPRDANDTVLPSFVSQHEAARDEVMVEIQRGGITKADADTGVAVAMDHWDVHEVGQIRLASTHKALQIIFEDNSDTEGDQYDLKAKSHEASFKMAMQNAIINLDTNDDGFEDTDEQGKTIGVTLSR